MRSLTWPPVSPLNKYLLSLVAGLAPCTLQRPMAPATGGERGCITSLCPGPVSSIANMFEGTRDRWSFYIVYGMMEYGTQTLWPPYSCCRCRAFRHAASRSEVDACRCTISLLPPCPGPLWPVSAGRYSVNTQARSAPCVLTHCLFSYSTT